ncbi:MAG: hypothetical protein NW215_10670 [Hyphomicrobiales bacterium]|nr:hypothetical protein [Hyphomicrobiales bacterium]
MTAAEATIIKPDKFKGPARALTRDEAMTYLVERGETRTSYAQLGAVWGWNPSSVKRFVHRKEKEGQLTARALSGNAGSVIRVHQALAAPEKREAEPPPRAGFAVRWPAFTQTGGRKPLIRKAAAPPKSLGIGARVAAGAVGAALLAAGLYMAVISVEINGWFGASQARDEAAARHWRDAAQVSEVVKVFGLSAALMLAGVGARIMAGGVFFMWGVATVYALVSAWGFASLNISDKTTARSSDQVMRIQTEADLAKKRAALPNEPGRPTDVIEADMRAERPRIAAPVWTATSGCIDVTIAASAGACQRYMALDAELRAARAAKQLEIEIKDLAGKLETLPKVADADPQVTTMLQAFAAFGATESGVNQLRLWLLVLIVELPTAVGVSAAIALFARVAFAKGAEAKG